MLADQIEHASCSSFDPIFDISSDDDDDANEDDVIYEIYEIQSDNELSANPTQYEQLVPSIDSKLNILNDIQPVLHASDPQAPNETQEIEMPDNNRSQYSNEQFPQGISANESKPAIANIIIHEEVRFIPNHSFIRASEADTTSK